ncbi:MAG: hypothetical protein FWG34_11780 [Oscillospiraceae bacterium]|jgi:hypothetical protein|nr:hypothetical protein [Oscillospiraceae bacterium]
MPDKRIYDTIEKMEPIDKGWSEDKKYCVKDFHYDVAKKAVSDERNRRQQSITQLIEEWKKAK